MSTFPNWFTDSTEEVVLREARVKRYLEASPDFHNNFTPIELCCEIVDKIHEQQPNEGKWLVIANIEFVHVVRRYFEFRNWDVSNIYFATPCELKKKVVVKIGILEYNIGKYNYETLDVCGDFKDMKFDVIVGNPPYQDSSRKSKVGSGSTLWDKIAIKLFPHIAHNGYIAFITPQSWMKPNHQVFNWMKKNKLIEVSTQIKQHFIGINSTFSYWIVQQTANIANHFSIIDGNPICIENIPYLVAQELISIHQKVVFESTLKFKIGVDWSTAHTQQFSKSFFTSNLSKEQNELCKYPVLHTNAQLIFCATKTKNFDDKKVLFTDSGYLIPQYDDGKLGSSERCKYILVRSQDEGTVLVNILKSKVYQFIVTTAKWSGFTDLTVLRSLPAVDLTRTWTDQELYQHFNLTQEEINLIEGTIK